MSSTGARTATMDPLLPFRALSPGTHKARVHRPKDSKLSLKSRSRSEGLNAGKENEPPNNKSGRGRLGPGRPFPKQALPALPALKYDESDLMTSDSDHRDEDEDEDEDREVDVVGQGALGGINRSVMSFGTQDSALPLPIAESTRCEAPLPKPLHESTAASATLHTAQEQRSSSDRSSQTDYHTAYPFPADCDESIVCISDSSPEAPRKTVIKRRPVESVLITSDESNCESEDRMVVTRLGKPKDKRLCDTVLLETSSDDDDDSVIKRTDCDIVIPSSIKSADSSPQSADSENSDRKLNAYHDVVVPPSPEIHSDSSLMSEDGGFDKDVKVASSSDVSEVRSDQCMRSQKVQDSFQFSGKFLQSQLDESSWKDDFHLVMPEPSREESENSKTDRPKMISPGKLGGAISKEKYNDIARWLFSEGDSPGGVEQTSHSSQVNEAPAGGLVSGVNADSTKHLQFARLSIDRSQLGGESNDNFNELLDSVRKNRRQNNNRNHINDDSFINDECASDVVESPSFNIYHFDLTRSIKAEVKSVQKSVRSLKKKQFFHRLYDSDEDGYEGSSRSPVNRPRESSKPHTKNSNNFRKYLSDSDESESELAKESRSGRIVNETSSEEKLWMPTSTTTKGQSKDAKKPVGSTKHVKDSRASESEKSGRNLEPRSRRKDVDSSDTACSRSSASSSASPEHCHRKTQRRAVPKKIRGVTVGKRNGAGSEESKTQGWRRKEEYQDSADSSSSCDLGTHKPAVQKKGCPRSGQVEKVGKRNGIGPEKFKTQSWRRNEEYQGSTDTSSSSDSEKQKPTIQIRKKDYPKKTLTKPAVPKGLSKKIAALKSPYSPRSPVRTFLSSLSGPAVESGVRDHPEATPYKCNFKAKKEELSRRLYKLYNREVFERRLPEDLVLEWNARLVRTAGLCYCKLVRKGGITTRTAKIALSTKVITSSDRLRDTLIHEMCHAAVWLLNNISGGHGPFWKAWAQKASKRFPELPPIERCHSYKIETKFTYKCTKCGYSFGRHSKSLDLDKKRCGYCYGVFEVFHTSKGPNTQDGAKTPKAPSAFALFVKENYGLLKKDNGNLKHGDIMKKLGEKFATMKVATN